MTDFLSVVDFEGNEIRFSDGRPQLFLFVSLFCNHCVEFLPQISVLQSKIPELGLVLFCNGDEEEHRDLKAYFQWDFPIVYLEPEDATLTYDVESFPYMILVKKSPKSAGSLFDGMGKVRGHAHFGVCGMILSSLGQCVLVFVFCISAISKSLDVGEFKISIRQFGILTNDRAIAAAAYLFILGEFAASVLIVFAFGRVITLVLTMALMTTFVAALLKVSFEKKTVHCNCFGQSRKPTNKLYAIGRNVVIIALILFLLDVSGEPALFSIGKRHDVCRFGEWLAVRGPDQAVLVQKGEGDSCLKRSHMR
ncbi:MauE/DoxX family redox-associated membrane protein [Paenibacillus sp. JTLBN-2024]